MIDSKDGLLWGRVVGYLAKGQLQRISRFTIDDQQSEGEGGVGRRKVTHGVKVGFGKVDGAARWIARSSANSCPIDLPRDGVTPPKQLAGV